MGIPEGAEREAGFKNIFNGKKVTLESSGDSGSEEGVWKHDRRTVSGEERILRTLERSELLPWL